MRGSRLDALFEQVEDDRELLSIRGLEEEDFDQYIGPIYEDVQNKLGGAVTCAQCLGEAIRQSAGMYGKKCPICGHGFDYEDEANYGDSSLQRCTGCRAWPVHNDCLVPVHDLKGKNKESHSLCLKCLSPGEEIKTLFGRSYDPPKWKTVNRTYEISGSVIGTVRMYSYLVSQGQSSQRFQIQPKVS